MSTGSNGRMRARDLDRVNACGLLDAAYAEGQLGADEYHDRTAKAGRAKTVGELARLTSDLQVPAAAGDLAPGGSAKTRKPLRRARTRASYPDHTRARNADRANTIRVLDDAHGEGQLDADEHQALTELASEAKTLGDLGELVADVQRAAAASPPSPPRSRRNLRFRAAVGVVAVLGVWAGYFAAGRDDSEVPAQAVPVELGTVQPLVLPRPELYTVAGMTLYRDKYREKFGDTLVDELWLHKDFASVQRIAPEGPQWSVDWDYWGGFTQHDNLITTRRPDTRSVDLATLNVEAIGAVLATAPAMTKVTGGVVDSIEISADGSSAGNARPLVEIRVRNDRSQHGSVVISPSGEVLKVREVG
ncbi:DUF1707 SHOCT-like domain-containing protein [Nocardia sp. bgisy118]|uniref:DUF1707 SHOCT-like domain-containing protein n=1 Tax=Nocardia sp. bgisy118 TaxID=3413786 RepID=UPI003F49BCAD